MEVAEDMATEQIDVDSMKVGELREQLEKRGLSKSGRKAELQHRLKEALESPGGEVVAEEVAGEEAAPEPAASHGEVVKGAEHESVDSMKVGELREHLQKRGLSTSGRKVELQARLREALELADGDSEPKAPVQASASKGGKRKVSEAALDLPASAGKTSRSKKEPARGEDLSHPTPKVCFTGVEPRARERKAIQKLNCIETSNVLEATHLIAGGEGVELKRTPKLLAGMNCCRFILDLSWLHDSAKAGSYLPEEDYILSDSSAEAKWGFNMAKSLAKRADKAGVLSGIKVFVQPKEKIMPLKELQMVVESGGGEWCTNPGNAKGDPDSLLVISHPDCLQPGPGITAAKAKKNLREAVMGRDGKAYLADMIYLSVLRQGQQWLDELAIDVPTDEA
ncbi:unnamed protein product [Chrysoparadoxa australica]